MLCPSCATQIPATPGSAPSAGTPSRATQAEERRIVTVLFADLVGFTALAEHRDPETVKRLDRPLLPAAGRRHHVVRRAGRQDPRRRHPGPVRRARGPRGRRRAGRAGRAADAGHADPLRRHVRPGRQRRDPHAHRHQHRRGAGRHARRHRLHGDGRRGQHRLPAADAAPPGRHPGRRRRPTRSRRRRSASSRPASSTPGAASRASRPGWRSRPPRRRAVVTTGPQQVRWSGASRSWPSVAPRSTWSRSANRSVLLAISGENGVGKSRLAEELVDYMQQHGRRRRPRGRMRALRRGQRVVADRQRTVADTSISTRHCRSTRSARSRRARAVQTARDRRRDRDRADGRRLRPPARPSVADRQARGTGGARRRSIAPCQPRRSSCARTSARSCCRSTTSTGPTPR